MYLQSHLLKLFTHLQSHTLKIEKNYTGSILTIIQEKINISVTTLLQKDLGPIYLKFPL